MTANWWTLSQTLDDDLITLGEQPIGAVSLAQEVIDRGLGALLRRHLAAPGSELEVLEGGRRTISRDRLICL
jgi:hypothetical protein